MPKQNRVTPTGEIVVVPNRGEWMGNRGLLHDAQQVVRRPWRLKAWIICLLSFKGRQREVMAPGRYTELFFLDEATAMAAGHRPCAECRRADYNRFKSRWLAANHDLLPQENPRIREVDAIIHQQRIDEKGRKKTYVANIDSLPDGVFIVHPEKRTPALIRDNRLWLWSPAGYQVSTLKADHLSGEILTPLSLVKTISHGYSPQIHHSAFFSD